MKAMKPIMCMLLVLSLQSTAFAKGKAKVVVHKPDDCAIFSNTLQFIASQDEKNATGNKLFTKVKDTGVVSINPSYNLQGTVYERFTRSASGRWMYRAVIAEVTKEDAAKLDSMAEAWATKLLPCVNTSNLWQKTDMELKATSDNRKYFLDYQNATDKNKKFWMTKSCVNGKCELVLMAG